MKQQIDNLIAKVLLNEREVCLPKVGTLILVRHAAELTSKRELRNPYYELRFTTEERGHNIIEHLVKLASISEERASDIYAEWFAQSRRDEVLSIERVCSIESGKANIDSTFESVINNQECRTTKLTPRKSYLKYIIATFVILISLGAGGYYLYQEGHLDSLFAKQGSEASSDIAVATTTETATSDGITIAMEPMESATEPIVEAKEVAEVVNQPTVAEESTPTEPVAEPVAEVAEKPTTLPMTKGRSYAVWGVYDKLKNAKEAKEWLAKKNPEIAAEIYEYDERYMVALGEFTSRKKCGRQVSAWKAQSKRFNSVWVYTR